MVRMGTLIFLLLLPVETSRRDIGRCRNLDTVVVEIPGCLND